MPSHILDVRITGTTMTISDPNHPIHRGEDVTWKVTLASGTSGTPVIEVNGTYFQIVTKGGLVINHKFDYIKGGVKLSVEPYKVYLETGGTYTPIALATPGAPDPTLVIDTLGDPPGGTHGHVPGHGHGHVHEHGEPGHQGFGGEN
jgi:hypothetical protein